MKSRFKKAFTLIEFIIVVSLLMILAIVAISVINPGLLTERARDAQRKKDANRIRVAFEEYFNDKQCFPTQAMVDALGCDGNGFQPWLSMWPCDPNGQKYYVYTDSSSCPKSYRILVNLKNRNDKQIQDDWYTRGGSYMYGDGSLSVDDVNYGVASQNTSWDTEAVPSHCYTSFTGCFTSPATGSCSALPSGSDQLNSYVNENCLPECLVSCCNSGKICVSLGD